MKIDDILRMTPETLAKTQHASLTEHVVNILESVLENVKLGRWDEIENQTCFSAAGDGMGDDNQFISFGSIFGKDHADIADVTERLIELEKIMNNE